MLKLFKAFIALIFLLFIISMFTCGLTYFYFSKDLPQISTIYDYNPPIVTRIYANDGRLIKEKYQQRRYVISLDQMPKKLIEAFIATEDPRFYQHKGIDLIRVLQALIKNWYAGKIKDGASTITQLVVKTFFLTNRISYKRKIKEIFLAYKLDRYLKKDEILFLYLNQIYFGNEAYGVEAAARTYFNKSSKDLNLAECAILAGIPRSPKKYNPIDDKAKSRERQNFVLQKMLEQKYITDKELMESIKKHVTIHQKQQTSKELSDFSEYILKYVEEKYGTEMLYTQGLTIETTLDIDMQKRAVLSVANGCGNFISRRKIQDIESKFYRGPDQHIDSYQWNSFINELKKMNPKDTLKKSKTIKGLITDINNKHIYVNIGNAKGEIDINNIEMVDSERQDHITYADLLEAGDVVWVKLRKKQNNNVWKLKLAQKIYPLAALISLESSTGYVKAMVGGYKTNNSSFKKSIFNMKRNPGTLFQPFIYSAALDAHTEMKSQKIYTAATQIDHFPFVIEENISGQKKERKFIPQYYKSISIRNAFTTSNNIVALKLSNDLVLDYLHNYSNKFLLPLQNLQTNIIEFAKGESTLSLLELIRAYSAFANSGKIVTPIFIKRIIDRNGKILELNKPQENRVIEESTAYIITSLLKDVVKEGDAKELQKLYRPIACQTGISEKNTDAWAIGYTKRFITGIWFGFEKEDKPLGNDETGGTTACPILLSFLKDTLKSHPVRVFSIPKGIEHVTIDESTGLKAIPESIKTKYECFKTGTEPKKSSNEIKANSNQYDYFKQNF